MKVLLYTEGLKTISKSGLGKAIKHQMKALEDNKIEYTTNLKDDYDILHVNFYGPKSYFYTKKMRKKGKKIVYHAHSTEEDFRNSFLCSNLVAPLFKKWICTCYKLGDQIITPTEYSKRLLENYNLNRPIKAISNGVDTKFFERNEEAGKEFRKKYGYKKNDKVIVGIGLYIERKGILDFVELAKRLPEYKFIWFGYSPLAASPRKIRKAVNTKLDNLCFAGYVESSVIKSALSGADLYLFPTLEETEGIPIIEALTSKIPTLIRDIPVFEEYEDKKVVYKARDVDDFERMIKLILKGKLPNLAEEGYKIAKKKDTQIVGKELIDTYKETLNLKRVEEPPKDPSYFKNIVLILMVILLSLTMMLSPSLNIDKLINKQRENNIVEKKEYSKKINCFDTTITIKLYSDSESKANKALEEAINIYQYYDSLTNLNNKKSELYKINNNESEDKTLTIDNNLYDLIKYGLELNKESNGLIDITNGELLAIWEEYRLDGKSIPSKKELEKITTHHKVELLKDNKIKNNHPNINLDYIKKGYTTDKVIDSLKLMGIDSYIITMDNMVVTGNYYKNNGKFNVGIASPFKDSDELLSSVKITNKVVVTTTKYQKYYEYKGKVYNHIIDNKTKYPATNMVGVTVLGDTCAESEALSVRLFLMDISKGQELVNKKDGVEAIWAFDDAGENSYVISDNYFNYR